MEKYGYSLFMNINGESLNVSTSSIKDILQVEGINNKNYSFLFNNISTAILIAISTIQANNKT